MAVFDPGGAFGDNPLGLPSVAPAASPPAAPGSGHPFDPGGAFGDNPMGLPSVPAQAVPTLPDMDVTCGQAVFGIAEGSTTGESGSAGYLHVPAAASLSLDGSDYTAALAGLPVQLALTAADPQAGDWRPGEWLTRTGGPSPGLYARLSLASLPGPSSAGRYRVYVQAAGYVLRAPGSVTFE